MNKEYRSVVKELNKIKHDLQNKLNNVLENNDIPKYGYFQFNPRNICLRWEENSISLHTIRCIEKEFGAIDSITSDVVKGLKITFKE